MRDTSSGRARVNPTGVRVAWTEARNAAVGAVHRGWPVVPGTCRPDEMGFSQVGPLEDTWDLAPVTDPEQAEDIWTRVLLVVATGSGGPRPDLAAVSVRLRGTGQWVALPPTTLGGTRPRLAAHGAPGIAAREATGAESCCGRARSWR